MSRKHLSTAIGTAVIALVSVTGLSAASFGLDPPVQVVGHEPVLNRL